MFVAFENSGRALNLPGSVMVAHQNLGLTVEVRILTGQLITRSPPTPLVGKRMIWLRGINSRK